LIRMSIRAKAEWQEGGCDGHRCSCRRVVTRVDRMSLPSLLAEAAAQLSSCVTAVRQERNIVACFRVPESEYARWPLAHPSAVFTAMLLYVVAVHVLPVRDGRAHALSGDADLGGAVGGQAVSAAYGAERGVLLAQCGDGGVFGVDVPGNAGLCDAQLGQV
jgi:hypothetical protein